MNKSCIRLFKTYHNYQHPFRPLTMLLIKNEFGDIIEIFDEHHVRIFTFTYIDYI